MMAIYCNAGSYLINLLDLHNSNDLPTHRTSVLLHAVFQRPTFLVDATFLTRVASFYAGRRLVLVSPRGFSESPPLPPLVVVSRLSRGVGSCSSSSSSCTTSGLAVRDSRAVGHDADGRWRHNPGGDHSRLVPVAATGSEPVCCCSRQVSVLVGSLDDGTGLGYCWPLAFLFVDSVDT